MDSLKLNVRKGMERYINVVQDAETNSITFHLQDGPIKEKGENGCQVDDIIKAARQIVEQFNMALPCAENEAAMKSLDETLGHLQARKDDREKRGVEGTNE